ncbi:hypothetical protein SAMN04488029_2254 [Reichenbachiella faecimaris]|uniref:Long-chain fatty acid transport protein n=1 Tax=Reichenbachiella faecimaris TaxID=692418 RepID=A0A1W2GE19_REIFA|nr:hypothetical protein [Reichenbachiella faecimaris]SMD34923.1 hypothetical protein SAMN04488029_2254 [Reichenbachiella faecimaris]
MSRVKWIIILAAFLSCKFVLAQNKYSPYTVIGVGDLNGMALANNAAMGNVGIATPSIWHVNNMNPALLTYNSLTVFEIGVEGENRTVSNSFNSVKVGTGGFKYLILAFPIMPNTWTSSIGLMPYSSVNYSFSTRQDVTGTNVDAIIDFEGDGGLNQVYFSNGIKVAKGLSAGLRMSYIFGLTEARTAIFLEGEGISQQFPTGVHEKTNYSGFDLGVGLFYSKAVSEKNLLNFGLTYDVGGDIKGTRFDRLEVETSNGSTVPGDTLINDQTGVYQLPTELGVGFSWQKLNKLTIGLDVKRSFWQENAGFAFDDASYVADAEKYQSTWAVGLGFEITPKYNDVNSYFKRVKYRFGVDFKQEPFVIEGKTVNNFGINFGWSLPVKGVSAINMAFKYGQRGEASEVLVKEQYFKFVLGATINDRWFVRRKYN